MCLWVQEVELPRSALLNRYCELEGNEYSQPVEAQGIRPFDMIGQRLYTGRIAVAQAALEYSKTLFDVTRQYSVSQSRTFLWWRQGRLSSL